MTRYLLIWSTFLGATCVYRHSGNIAITFIQDLVPKSSVRHAHRGACNLLLLFRRAAGFQFKYCGKLVKTATALPIKMKYIYLCIPISMGILMLHALVMALGEVETMKEVKG
ncbi:MAG: TRAP transporter small permease [Christensenellales bacterium]